MDMVLSHFQTAVLLKAKQEGRSSTTSSLDLGLTTVEIEINSEGVLLPDGGRLSWEVVEIIDAAKNSCFVVLNGSAKKIQVFSEETNRLYTLFPTDRAPTMLISGTPMHRIKGTDPRRDTLAKIKTIAPIFGHVLDTATGLGYTAIAAAETAERVTTIERDAAALQVAHANPWSRALFNNPKIEQIIGDSIDVVPTFQASSFDSILHDPPMFNLAGELYSAEFYAQLYRVLHSRGRLFHYVGDLESKSGGHIVRGVIRRLQEAGFKGVERRADAFGVVASK